MQVLTNVAGRKLSSPDLVPFWAEAEALGAVVVPHPAGFTEPRRFGRFYFGNVISNPLDTTMALHYLIFDGVTDYPYDMAEYDPVGHLAAARGLSQEQVDAIAGGNAVRLLGL